MTSNFETLTEINLNDLVASFGWQDYPLLSQILRKLFSNPARQFAEQMLDFDNKVSELGLAEASRRVLQTRYVRDVRMHGIENIPTTGPALFLSNHPGVVDTISLFAAIRRADLKIIAIHRPFLVALKNATEHLFFIDDDPSKRMNAVRQVAAHLKNGGVALTFPAGEIEPDPDVYEGALDSFNKWMDSAAVFLRFARDAVIVPTLVSGVVWEKTARHPLTRIKRTRVDREKLAAALQLLAMVSRNERPTTVQIQFARPIKLEEVGSTDAQAIHKIVLGRMRELLTNPPKDNGISALK